MCGSSCRDRPVSGLDENVPKYIYIYIYTHIQEKKKERHTFIFFLTSSLSFQTVISRLLTAAEDDLSLTEGSVDEGDDTTALPDDLPLAPDRPGKVELARLLQSASATSRRN